MTRPFYKPGSFWRIDDRSGFKVRAEDQQREWTNLLVRKQSFEMRHPQDFVRGVVDDQNVPFARPRPDISNLPSVAQLAGGAQILVMDDPLFLVESGTAADYTPGVKNSGTAMFRVGNGRVPRVTASGFPNSMTGA